jgi:hypothetical protein
MINLKTASLAFSLAVLATAANAQSVIQYSDSQGYGYRTEPLYPYAPPQRGATRVEKPRVETRASAAQPTRKVDPALIEELRKKRKPTATSNTKPKASEDITASVDKTPDNKKITRTIVVREKPIVRNTYRVVEHPPIVVQREVGEDHVAEGEGPAQGSPLAAPQGTPLARRTIRAEAEITILGPDRMSIRLYRKQDGGDANAKVAKPAPKPASKPALKRSAGADSKTKIR